MGNCQATEAATVVIQHPGGRVERLYWPTSAEQVMRSNPGHYVALVTLCVSKEQREGEDSVRLTRVRLLKPKDTLLFGQVYRLITSQEVTKAIRARKYEKMKKTQSELIKKQQQEQQRLEQLQSRTDGHEEVLDGERQPDSESINQVAKLERERQKSSTQSAGRARQWRPSLQSISEVGS
ncbi:uncharacterized protein LOC120106399 [Phoenix dactylifera]|uniref:Uncharacterized protein LOC103710033 n=1 Tax=Phoenix dactylifera TaxID=42345 RepID=A0A8B7C8A0_PHODC|nr:uncharacterized protein LOC103710033 [Phoenix dactylifera]XP_038975326.1 uncharacterized protein LOC120106399 [Phoenix dactylifera]